MPQALPPNLRLLRKAFHSLEVGLDKIGPDVPLMGLPMAPEHLFSAGCENLYREPLRPVPKGKSVEMRHVETRSMMIRRRFGEMKQRSTTKNPICYRCGSPGHFAPVCRNAQKCLVCKGHGHHSSICTAQPFRLPHPLKPPLQSPPLVNLTPPGLWRSAATRSAFSMQPWSQKLDWLSSVVASYYRMWPNGGRIG